MKPEDLTIEIVEKAIGIPSSKWDGRCYEVACRIVAAKLVNGTAVYGHYTGPVAKTGYWAGRRDRLLQRHGWIVLDDGRILDPTRWSFEDKKPYLHHHECNHEFICGNCEHVPEEHEELSGHCVFCVTCSSFRRQKCDYDEGGNSLREAMLTPPPPFKNGDKIKDLPLCAGAKDFVMTLLGSPQAITMPMLFWLGNLPVKKLGEFAPDVYKALIKSGREAIIPIDNRRMVLGSYG